MFIFAAYFVYKTYVHYARRGCIKGRWKGIEGLRRGVKRWQRSVEEQCGGAKGRWRQVTGRYKGIKDQLKIFTLRKKKLEGNEDVLNSDKEALTAIKVRTKGIKGRRRGVKWQKEKR